MKIAIYPGTFNPWTTGHQDILERALTVFDAITVLVAKNPDKDVDTRFIKWTLTPVADAFNGRVSIVSTDRRLVSSYNIPIIRGVRSGDWEYEQNLAIWNKELGVETFFLCPDPKTAHINSSALRMLEKANKDISVHVGNDFSAARWRQHQIPEVTLYAGRIAVGKSTYLKQKHASIDIKDCDKLFWDYFDAVACDRVFETETFAERIRRALLAGDVDLYHSTLQQAAPYVDWKGMLTPNCNYEVSALGMWWPYIPVSILAQFKIVELDCDYGERLDRISKRDITVDYVTFLDTIYKTPHTIDERIWI